jgi:GntR family transcriptional regulator
VKPGTNDPRSAYLQVADDLRTGIMDHTFKPGQRLPSGRELARRYGVAAMTISHALDVLRKEQLVQAYPGRGVFVTGAAVASPEAERSDLTITALRGDLDQLAERVARIEQILANGGGSGSETSRPWPS